MIPLNKRHIDEGNLKKNTVIAASQQPPTSIGEHDINPQSSADGTDLRSTYSRRRSPSESILEEAPEDEAVFNMYRANVPYFVSNFDCNPVTPIKSTDDLIHIFECTANKCYDDDERTFWSQFNATDGEKTTIRGPPAIASQKDDCDMQNLCVSIFDYLFGGGDSTYNQVNMSQSIGNVPPVHSAAEQQRKVYPRNPCQDTAVGELTAFEVTFSEVEDIALEKTFTRIEKRRKWPFSKQSKTQPPPNMINDALFKSYDFSKKLTIIETEGDSESISVEIPKVIFTPSPRVGQKPSITTSKATPSPAASLSLDDKDNGYNAMWANHAIVTPEKPNALVSNENEVEELLYQSKPILRTTSAKNRHLLLALKLTPEKTFHFTNTIPSPSHSVTQNYKLTNQDTDPIMTTQDQQPREKKSLKYLPSKVQDEHDFIIQPEEVEEHNDSSAILDDLREEQKIHSVSLEGDAVTIASNDSAWSSPQRQKYLSFLSGTEEDSNHSFTPIKNDRLEYNVNKVLLMFVEKQVQLETSGLLDKSFIIHEESSMQEQTNEESINDDSTPTMEFYNTAIQPKSKLLYQGISNSDEDELFSAASGLKKNQPSLINFVLKPPSGDSFPFNYTRAANFRQTLVDCEEYSPLKSFQDLENFEERKIIVAANETASSFQSSQNPFKSILKSQHNDFFAPSTGNATTINNSSKGYASKQKAITIPTIRIKSLAENVNGNPVLTSAPLTVLSKPSVTEQKPIISNDDLLFVTSTQNNGKSCDSVGDDSTVETSNVTSLKKENKMTIQRLKHVPPLSAIFGRSSIVPFSALEDDEVSEQEAIHPFPEVLYNVPLKKKPCSESSSLLGDTCMGIVDDIDSKSIPVQEGYRRENTELDVSDSRGKNPGEKFAKQFISFEPNVAEVTAADSLNAINRRRQAIIPDVTTAHVLNANRGLPKQRGISDGEQSVSHKVMIEACDMSIISEMSATSKFTSKNANKEKIVTKFYKKTPVSRLELFLSANKENDPSTNNGTLSVRTGSYSVATERAKIHSRFADETKGKGWVATMKIASSGEWSPNGGWIDMNDELYRKCFADDLSVGMRSRSSQLQSKDRTEKELSSHVTGNALTKAHKASTTTGCTLANSIKGSAFHDNDLPPQLCDTDASSRYLKVATKPALTTEFQTKSDAQHPIPSYREKNDVFHNCNNTPTKNFVNTFLTVDFSDSRGPSSIEPANINVKHESPLQMKNYELQFQGGLVYSTEEPVVFGANSQFLPPPPPPPPKSRLPKGNQVYVDHNVHEYNGVKKNTMQEENNGDGFAFASSSTDIFSSIDIKINDPHPESNETVDLDTVYSNEITENSRKSDDSSNGNRSVASNLIDFVKCGVRGELPSAHLDFLRRGTESSDSHLNSKSRFHSFTSAMFSCGSNKASLNTIQEDEEEIKDVTKTEATSLRNHHFQKKNFNDVSDEKSESSRDTLSQFFNDEVKESHRLARVRVERLAAKRVDTMINSSFSEEYNHASNTVSQLFRPESGRPLSAALV